jgi:penicillin-binding protein 1A
MLANAYYVEYAIYDVVTKMLRVENWTTYSNRSAMENKLRTGGYSIYTSLDPKIQEAVQEVVTGWDKYPEPATLPTAFQDLAGRREYISWYSRRPPPRD